MLEREKGFNNIFANRLGIRIDMNLKVASETRNNSLMKHQSYLLDETDFALLDEKIVSAKEHDSEGFILGFTVTMFRTDKGQENNYLKALSFICYESLFHRTIAKNAFERSLEEFLNEKAGTGLAQVKMIYC